ncbi:unnamed protein product [Rhizopus stolonifer]
MQTRRKNKQKATALTDGEQLSNLKDDLHVPHFWIHVVWSSWSITNYDKVATREILGLKKARAHEFLKDDLTDVLGVLNPVGRRFRRAKQMEKDLNKIGKDTCNLQFWSLYSLSNTFSETRSQLAEVSIIRDLIRKVDTETILLIQEHFETAAITRAADVLNKNGKSRLSQSVRLVLLCFHYMTVFNSFSSCSEAANDTVAKEDITFYETLSNSTAFSKNRHHLFKLAYSLYTGKKYEIPHDIETEILSSNKTEEDQLNRASLIIMQQHPFEDPNLGNMLRLTLSMIIDVAHHHNMEFMKRVVSVPRYNELESKQFELWCLSPQSEQIVDNIAKAIIL